MKEFTLIGFVGVLDDLARDGNPSAQLGGKIDHRPIAAPHYTIPAETLEAVFDVRTHDLGGCASRFAVGKHAGDFAGDVGQT